MNTESKNKELQIFITGGTFDKDYNILTGELYFVKTSVPNMLKRGRSTLRVDVKTLMMIDSLFMTNELRKVIVDNCKECDCDKIVITHGTDTMVQTAKYLADANITDKTIVITGAIIPYSLGNSSDGFFNLGNATAFAQVLPPGVYIAMNGRYYDWDNVQKDYETGFFEKLAPAKNS